MTSSSAKPVLRKLGESASRRVVWPGTKKNAGLFAWQGKAVEGKVVEGKAKTLLSRSSRIRRHSCTGRCWTRVKIVEETTKKIAGSAGPELWSYARKAE